MSIALVGSPVSNGVTNTGSVTITITGVTAGNLLTAVVSILQASNTAQAAITPTDTNGTWADCNSPSLANDAGQGICHGVMQGYQKNCASGSHTVTYTFPNGVTYAELTVCEWSAADATAPFDSSVTNRSTFQTGSTSTTLTVGTTGALAQANNLILAGVSVFQTGGTSNAGISDPPAGYTALYHQQDTSTSDGAEHCYKLVTSPSGVSVTWSWTGSDTADSAGLISVFKEAAAGGDTLFGQVLT